MHVCVDVCMYCMYVCIRVKFNSFIHLQVVYILNGKILTLSVAVTNLTFTSLSSSVYLVENMALVPNLIQ